MENIINQEKLFHKHLISLDNDLNTKLINHVSENDMTLTGVVRRSLRIYLEGGTKNQELIHESENKS